MLQHNYLTESEKHIDKSMLNCGIAINFDESYAKIYPNIPRKQIATLVATLPKPSYKNLTNKIKQKFRLKNILLGSGGEDLIIRANTLIERNSYKVGIVVPTFYRILEILGAGNYQMITETEFLSDHFNELDVIIVTNPSLISGNVYNKRILLKIFQRNRSTIFIVDEIGIFPMLNWKKYSLMDCLFPENNILVFSSFSKLYGLAGLRAGFASGNQRFLDKMRQTSLTFPLTGLTEYFLLDILDKEKEFQLMRKRIQIHKKEIEKTLQKIPGLQIKKSMTNCVFCKKNNISLYDLFLRNGIFTLKLDNQEGIVEKNYIRITVHSSRKLHAQLMRKLGKMLKSFI